MLLNHCVSIEKKYMGPDRPQNHFSGCKYFFRRSVKTFCCESSIKDVHLVIRWHWFYNEYRLELQVMLWTNGFGSCTDQPPSWKRLEEKLEAILIKLRQ
ncbi:uncharacterized protein LOC143223231 isoform X2 [Tachypleus tridentatus]|uniref:uncharacterized protein LOC143223231 isoform X2 n=1 Tax=Tachypleus tridentatus TaxID=6853 RepID=UPI003FD4EC24